MIDFHSIGVSAMRGAVRDAVAAYRTPGSRVVRGTMEAWRQQFIRGYGMRHTPEGLLQFLALSRGEQYLVGHAFAIMVAEGLRKVTCPECGGEL